jgi:hypothetical protein
MQGCLLGNILRIASKAKRDYDCRVERFQLLIADVGQKHGVTGVMVYLEDSKLILDAMSAATEEDFLKLYDDHVSNMVTLLDQQKYDDAYTLLLALLSEQKTKYHI